MVALKVQEIFAAEAKKRQQEAGKEHGRGQAEKLVADLPQAIAASTKPSTQPTVKAEWANVEHVPHLDGCTDVNTLFKCRS